MEHPAVIDAAVCGVYNEEGTSEVPIAYIKTRGKGWQEQAALETEVRKFVDRQVARYKQVEGGVHIISVIPRKYVSWSIWENYQ